MSEGPDQTADMHSLVLSWVLSWGEVGEKLVSHYYSQGTSDDFTPGVF